MNQTMEKFINFKQLNVVSTGTSTADGSAALTLTDSAATFTQRVLVNSIVWDRTTSASVGGAAVTTVTSVSKTSLMVADDIFVNNDNYLVYKEGADDHNKIVRSAGVADVSNSATTSSINNITYDTALTAIGRIDYAYSSTIGANSLMRSAIQDAVVASLETEWTDVTYELRIYFSTRF